MVDKTGLCACGSGVFYKDCCGSNKTDAACIKENRLTAYAGESGKRRREFCVEYTQHKQEALAGLTSGLREEASQRGKAITCGKGCSACCYVYVVASLQECDAISYYLYQHREVLDHFLNAYKAWRSGIEGERDNFFEISRLQQKRMSGDNAAQDDGAFDAELIKYAGLNLPCPFLKNNACTIYEVRPYVCAGLVSITPREWCAPDHPRHSGIGLLKADVSLDSDMPYFGASGNKVALTNMPALVYEILRYGWDFLSCVPGMEALRNKIKLDILDE
jgi:Fe-S-cluster containining protein